MRRKPPVPVRSKIETVAIIGAGLIGGSIGLALKAGSKQYRVIGVGRRWSSLRLAQKLGAVDEITLGIHKGLEQADLIILAAPVAAIIRHLNLIAGFISPGVIVTDAGSTKVRIVQAAEKALDNKAFFVGAHPLAGSEKRGVSAARADLYKGSVCVVTPTARTNPQALKTVKDFWKSLGAEVRLLTPEDHDKIISRVSHLPHIASVALCRTLLPEHIDYAAAGFKDTTRIAMSDAGLWADICFSNRAELKDSIELFIKNVRRLEKYISSGRRKEFIEFWDKAGRLRQKCK